MRDFLYIGSTPHEEECAQVGQADYSIKAKAECKRFAEQIDRHYPLPDNASMGYLKIKANYHDFGTYYEVVAVFDDECELSTNWAFSIEADELGVLSNWDELETN